MAELYSSSLYGLGVEGLESILRTRFGNELDDLLDASDFQGEPRRLDEILEAEAESYDRIWYHRSLQREYRAEAEHGTAAAAREREVAAPARARVERKYPGPGLLGPYTDFELDMLNGKLSAIRWVLGSEWDFLDT